MRVERTTPKTRRMPLHSVAASVRVRANFFERWKRPFRFLLILIWTSIHQTAFAHTTHFGRTEASISHLESSLELYFVLHKRFPSQAEGLTALVKEELAQSQKTKDAWGRDIVYRFPTLRNVGKYDLYSFGADGISKTGGDDPDDINNWDPEHKWRKYYFKQMSRDDLMRQLPTVFVVGSAMAAVGIWLWLSRKRSDRILTDAATS